jgi:molybdopterin-guanine dinucleotide biosynthesis protein A
VVIVGAGEVPAPLSDRPRLGDAPDAAGPLAGLLAAMRWAPTATWLAAACDHPDLSADALVWLADQRRPGTWAIQPRLQPSSDPDDCRVEPLLAVYDLRARSLLERLAGRGGDYRLSDLAADAKVATPVVPADLASAWRNVNASVDLQPGE